MSDVITHKQKLIYKLENKNIRLNRWDAPTVLMDIVALRHGGTPAA